MRVGSRAILTLLLGFGTFAMANGAPPRDRRDSAQRYSISQAISEQAQLHTIAFSGLAFVTGDFGSSTFLPPGKVCDYFGFQYMRDIDAQGAGHNPKFLNRVAGNVLLTLDEQQKTLLIDLARRQAPQFKELAERRFPVIKAFHRQLDRELPPESEGLNRASVSAYVADIFALDAELSIERAEAYGKIVSSLNDEQKAYFAKMKFGDFESWPDVSSEAHRLPRGTEKTINVAYMTYASEFFSWYAGNVEADVYFCPERHGTYFGGFYMKDLPAMGKRDFDISTSVTGDSGKAFLQLLTPEQRQPILDLPGNQREAMNEIVNIRRQVSIELRKVITGESIDHKKVIRLGQRYGELDGAMSCDAAVAFAAAGNAMNDAQRAAAMKLRNLDGYVNAPAYLYSTPLRESPAIGDSNRFFFPPTRNKP